MEKKHILIALAAIMLVVGSVLTVRAIRKVNTTSIIFEKNLNALVDDEGSSFSFCYNEYDFSLIHRIMRCGDCEYVWGKGDNYGGICY